jgi:fibronectin-binding autotransporter adhesin
MCERLSCIARLIPATVKTLIFIMVGGALSMSPPVVAADYSWNSGSASSWSTAGNWLIGGSPPVDPPTNVDNVVTPTQFGAANLSSGVTTIDNLAYSSATGWEILASSGSATSLAINGIVNKTGGGNLTFRGTTSGVLAITIGELNHHTSGSLNFGTTTGALSSLTVTGNTFTGRPTAVALVTGGGANFAAVTTNDEFNIGAGAANTVSSTSVTSLSGSSSGRIQNASGGSLNVASTLTINSASGSSTFAGIVRNNSRNISNPVANTIHVVKSGTGTQIFQGNNTYTGNTTVNGGGTLRITNGNGLGFGGIYGATTAINGSVVGLDIIGKTFVTGGSKLDLAGNITVNEEIELTSGQLLNSSAGTEATLNNGLAGIRTNFWGSTGSGTTVTISGGGGSGAAAAAFITGNNVTYMQLSSAGSGYTSTPTVTIGDRNATFTAVLSSLVLNGTSNTIGGDGNLVINAAIIGSTGAFQKVGDGVVTLNGTNSYGGATTVSAGTLRLGAAGTLASSGGSITINGTGKLDSTVSSVSLNRTINLEGGFLDPNGATVGSVALAADRNFNMSGGTILLKLGASFDQIVSAGGTGVFSITGGTLELDVTDESFSYENTYQVLSGFGGSSSVNNLAFTGFDIVNYDAALSPTGVLKFSAVPEPSGVAICLIACSALAKRQRRVRP